MEKKEMAPTSLHMLEGRQFCVFTDHKPLAHAIHAKPDRYSPREVRNFDYVSQFSPPIYVMWAVRRTLQLMLSHGSISTPSTQPSPSISAGLPRRSSGMRNFSISEPGPHRSSSVRYLSLSLKALLFVTYALALLIHNHKNLPNSLRCLIVGSCGCGKTCTCF